MKNRIVSFIVVVCIMPNAFIAQTTGQNFIKKTSPISPVSTEANLNALGSSYKVESISYIDGLGRTLQDVLIKGSPVGNDIVQPYFYDVYGRQSVQLLPYVDATLTGTYRDQAFNAQPVFYNNQTMVAKTTKPYAEMVFDGSPLNEVKEKSAPDTDWQLGNGHTTKVVQSTNGDLDVLFWYQATGGDYILNAVQDYFYPANSLSVTKLTDANGSYSYVYTDKKGKTICTKQFVEMRNMGMPGGDIYGRLPGTAPYYLTTYMVYDDFGQLVLVIPPKAMELMDASGNYSINALTEELVFRYKYDERHRLIEKKVPGTGWSYIVYNQLNQPVLFRDANLTAQNKWSFIKYDVMGRPVLSGLMNSSGMANYQTRVLAQAEFNANQAATGESEVLEDAANPFGYTNVTLPIQNLSTQNLEFLTVNYYDDYDFNNDGTADYTFNTATIPCIVFNISVIQNTNSNMQAALGNMTVIESNLKDALGRNKDEDLQTALTDCEDTYNSLNEQLTSAQSLSQSLLQTESSDVLNSLKSSLTGDVTTLVSTLRTRIEICSGLDNAGNLTGQLSAMSLMRGKIADLVSISISNINTILSGCQPYANAVANRTRGYLTGSRVKVLDPANPVQWEISTVFYDEEGQSIQSQSNDHMGGTDLINMVYDFTGNVIHSQQVHSLTGQTSIQVLNHMSYDKMGRLLRVDQKNNNDFPVILTKYAYNELSQLIDKKVHSINNGSTFLQSMDYRYNIHGDLTSINNIDLSSDMAANPLNGTNDDVDDLWGMQLNYNTNTSGINGVKQYTGNVAEKKWRSVTDNIKRAYGYNYDKADRLVSSAYVEYNTGASSWNSNSGKFDEKDITYDANGNIKTLKRYGFQVAGSSFGLIDNLSYQYNGNFLGSVTDASSIHGSLDFKDNGSTGTNEYTYDGNGNLTSNPNKSITNIAYNHLNLPTQITFSGTNKKIEYTYDAAGTRLRKKVSNNTVITTKNYASVFEYVDNSGSTILESMHTAEGRCVLSNAPSPQFRYEYQYTDNTGNVAMAFSDIDNNGTVNPGTEVIQQNHYYSFGMRIEGTGVIIGVPENKYKFSGKEFDDELGLNEYDFGARFYDPAIARWGSIDPMADAAPNWTPFRYAFNNPVIVTDPTGMLEAGANNFDNEDDKDKGAKAKKVSDGSNSMKVKGAKDLVSQPPPAVDNSMTSIQVTSIGGEGETPEISGGIVEAEAPADKKEEKEEKEEGNDEGDATDMLNSIRYNASTKSLSIDYGSLLSSNYIKNQAIEGVQTTFDGVGLVPGVGEIFDGANAVIYFARGDKLNGSLSLAAMIPLAGWAATGGKVVKKLVTNSDLVEKAAKLAERAIARTGGVAGTAKHVYANNLLKRYQKIYGDRGLSFNQYFNNGVGNRGFLDVVDHGSKSIYDYKFGSGIMGNSQYLKYSNNFKGYSIQIIKP